MIQVRFVSYQYNRWKRAVDKLRARAMSEKDNLPRRMSIDYIDEIFTRESSMVPIAHTIQDIQIGSMGRMDRLEASGSLLGI